MRSTQLINPPKHLGAEILSHMSELKPSYTYITSDDQCQEQQLLPEYDPTIRRHLEFLMTSLS